MFVMIDLDLAQKCPFVCHGQRSQMTKPNIYGMGKYTLPTKKLLLDPLQLAKIFNPLKEERINS